MNRVILIFAIGLLPTNLLTAQTPTSGTKLPVVFNTTYTCANGQAHFQILSCSGKGGPDEQCVVQYLNAYSSDGKGARVDVYRSMLNEENSLKGCTLPAGTPLPSSTVTSGVELRSTVTDSRNRASAAPPGPAATQSAGCAGSLQPGASIEAQWRGSWYAATLVGCKSGQYQIRYASDKSEELVDAARVRTSAPANVASRGASPTSVKPGNYGCAAFIGTPPNGHLQPMPGIQILGGSAYVHSTGNSRGTFTYDAAQSLIVFKGGNLDGQAAKYDQSPEGKPSFHIYNERRSRTVIDCDGPN